MPPPPPLSAFLASFPSQFVCDEKLRPISCFCHLVFPNCNSTPPPMPQSDVHNNYTTAIAADADTNEGGANLRRGRKAAKTNFRSGDIGETKRRNSRSGDGTLNLCQEGPLGGSICTTDEWPNGPTYQHAVKGIFW